MPTNRYPGQCYRCGGHCDTGEGHFERIPGVGWQVQHLGCAVAYRGTKVGKGEPVGPRPDRWGKFAETEDDNE